MSLTEFTCIQCPIGCPLQLTHEGREIVEVKGYSCKRGDKYARQEFVDPRRSLSTTIRIDGALWGRLPVKISGPIPKDKVLDAAKTIHQLRARAPVERGQILLENILGFDGIHVVACREMAKTG
ncbi:MAG: DUF1667 domain-containing protein [Deltaproteobacteria bacterium]|nr:DUF1667 domain-containing protein [Deltaproteobacteria bacterium]